MAAYLVMGCTDLTMSYSWSPTARRGRPPVNCMAYRAVVSYRTWPEMMNMGMESSQPPTTPVSALVPPGPVVTQTAAMRLSSRA